MTSSKLTPRLPPKVLTKGEMMAWFTSLLSLLLLVVCFRCGESENCSFLAVNTPAKLFTDTSWNEYLDSVYGSDRPLLNKDEIDFIYKGTPVKVRPHDWNHERLLGVLKESWGDTYYHHSTKTYADNEWAEVARYSTSYLNSYRNKSLVWEEGFSIGFPGRWKMNETKVGYGCWFNVARGSGIFVNVGRTLVTPHKYSLTFASYLGLTSKGCLPTDTTGDKCDDRYFCTAAVERGYDSIQVMSHSELIICTGKCLTESVTGACPPVELRSGFRADRSCSCRDMHRILNCGDHPEARPQLSFKLPPASTDTFIAKTVPSSSEPYRHTACISRSTPAAYAGDFEVTVAFTSGVMRHPGMAGRVVRALESATRDSSVLLDVSGSGRQHHRPSERTSSSLHHEPKLSPILHEAGRAGYRVVLAAASETPPLVSSSSLQVLSSSYDGHEKAALVEVGKFKVGVIAFSPVANISDPAHPVTAEVATRQLLDEADCLRYSGADLVLLLSDGDPRGADPVLLSAASRLVDLIVGVVAPEAAAPVTCSGGWHNSSANGTAMVLIKDSEELLGIVRVTKDKHGLAFKSSHITL